MAIPIQNIYYLLCYSWDKLDEKEFVDVDAEESSKLLDLFAKVLLGATLHIVKRGLDKYYIEEEEAISGIKGKLDLNTSLKKNLFSSLKAHCIYDDFSHNVLTNQIIKSTISKLLRATDLDSQLKVGLRKIFIRFSDISEIKLNNRVFRKVTLHRNNYFYDFALKVCELINSNLFMNESDGTYSFMEFERDEKRMSYVFESFVRNFYKREQSNYSVGREVIDWQFEELAGGDNAFLPKMETDISLVSSNKKIIIDTKYYKETLQSYYDSEKIHSTNLYQLFAYLKNVENKDVLSSNCQGVLLYPTIDNDIKLDYKHGNHKVSVRTIDLNQDWKKIHNQLLEIVA